MSRLKQHFLEDNNDIQIQEIKGAMKNNNDKNMHVRYLVIYNHLKGFQNIEISKMVGLCQHTVGTSDLRTPNIHIYGKLNLYRKIF